MPDTRTGRPARPIRARQRPAPDAAQDALHPAADTIGPGRAA